MPATPSAERSPRRRAGGTVRQRQLHRLAAAVRRFRGRLARVRWEIAVLADVDARRSLTPEEARQMTLLQVESESLRLELERLRAEFVAMMDGQPERRAGEVLPDDSETEQKRGSYAACAGEPAAV